MGVCKTARRARGQSGRYDKNELESGQSSIQLSEATAHLDDALRKDMERWVHRPRDQRHEEAQRDGRIRRPMNPFMLYRCAFYGLIGKLLSEKGFTTIKPQDISRVAGSSWQIESPHVKEKYRRLAARERKNFVDAFPGYKFEPKKGSLLRKRARDQSQMGPPQDVSPNGGVLSDGYDNHGNMCVESHRPYLAAQNLSGLSGTPHPDLLLLPHESRALTHYPLEAYFEPQQAYYNNSPIEPAVSSFGPTAYEETYGETWVTATPKALLLDPLSVPEWTFQCD